MTGERIGVGGIRYETNSFGTQFPRGLMFMGDSLREGEDIFTAGPVAETSGAAQEARQRGVTLVGLIDTWAPAGAPSNHVEYLRFKAKFLDRLSEVVDTLDGLILPLHGAMTTTVEDDPEADFVRGVRAVVGPDMPIVVTHDLHGSPSPSLIEHVDALVGYKTCPHVDQDKVGAKALRIVLAAVRGEIRPRTISLRLPMLTPAEGHDTIDGPLAAVTRMIQAEASAANLVDESVFMCQPWLDTHRSSWRLTAVIDELTNSAENASALLQRHAELIWSLRESLAVEKVSISNAMAAIREHAGNRPLLLADGGDSPSAGSVGDSTDLLEQLVENPDPRPRLAIVTDPIVAAKATRAGVGAEIDAALGGATSGLTEPIRVRGRVGAVGDGRFMRLSPPELADYGPTATIVVGCTTVVVTSSPAQMLDQTIYRHMGLDPMSFHAIQIKSAGGFRALWKDVSTDIVYVDTRGASDSSLTRLPFQHLADGIWPFDPTAELEAADHGE